eukprot:sb/3476217/
MVPVGRGKKAKKTVTKYVLDCTHPAEDSILDPADFVTFLNSRVKVAGKTNNLGNSIMITKEKNCVNLSADIPLSKRYLKYLTKKYLKKQNLRDWLRVVSNSKNSFELRYFQVDNEETEE